MSSEQLTLFERTRRRMEHAATPTVFQRCTCDACNVEDGYEAGPCQGKSALEMDRIARSRGDKWRQSQWLLPEELVIRDERLV